jgi:peptidoglycan/xylan/chitin deacetylase (PgdA/CDA1 family)
MNVFLTFDIEIWCNSWQALDARFPAAFERYVYGRSRAGDYALPKTLEILNRHGLRGVFFVEPLFAARFGVEHLATVTGLIRDAGQEVQMHLHPEWTDEIDPPLFPDKPFKRQHLIHYSRAEQTALLRRGLVLLAEAGCEGVTAFRAGSFAANADTLAAAEACGLTVDASLNMCYPHSGADLRAEGDFYFPRRRDGLQLLPMSVFRDGLGRLRHAQVGACSAAELCQAIEDSAARGHPGFTVLSHNFEMLRAGSTAPDRIVAGRFEALCRFLGEQRERFPTRGLAPPPQLPAVPANTALAQVGCLATLHRYAGQAARRLAA